MQQILNSTTISTARFGLAGQVFRVVSTRLRTIGRPPCRMSDLDRRIQQLNFNATPLPPRCPRPQPPVGRTSN